MIDGYNTVSFIAEKWELKPRTIQMMCAQGKIEGATKVGNVWVIPDNTEKPIDLRIKSGRYIKEKYRQEDEKC